MSVSVPPLLTWSPEPHGCEQEGEVVGDLHVGTVTVAAFLVCKASFQPLKLSLAVPRMSVVLGGDEGTTEDNSTIFSQGEGELYRSEATKS